MLSPRHVVAQEVELIGSGVRGSARRARCARARRLGSSQLVQRVEVALTAAEAGDAALFEQERLDTRAHHGRRVPRLGRREKERDELAEARRVGVGHHRGVAERLEYGCTLQHRLPHPHRAACAAAARTAAAATPHEVLNDETVVLRLARTGLAAHHDGDTRVVVQRHARQLGHCVRVRLKSLALPDKGAHLGLADERCNGLARIDGDELRWSNPGAEAAVQGTAQGVGQQGGLAQVHELAAVVGCHSRVVAQVEALRREIARWWRIRAGNHHSHAHRMTGAREGLHHTFGVRRLLSCAAFLTEPHQVAHREAPGLDRAALAGSSS